MSDPVILTGAEVISMEKNTSFVNRDLCRPEHFYQALNATLEGYARNYIDLANKGVEAEVLRPGKDWQKGTLKVRVIYQLEFTPDSAPPLSPLADLRSDLNL